MIGDRPTVSPWVRTWRDGGRTVRVEISYDADGTITSASADRQDGCGWAVLLVGGTEVCALPAGVNQIDIGLLPWSIGELETHGATVTR